MVYLIDTGIVIDHLMDDPAATNLIAELAVDGIAISMITYMEAFQGILRGSDLLDSQRMFNEFLSGTRVLPFSEMVAQRCAQLRNELQDRGKRIRPRALDLITAATALHGNLTLVTRNKADYSDISGLSLY
jgi:predicted nucleic acid-binding protein